MAYQRDDSKNIMLSTCYCWQRYKNSKLSWIQMATVTVTYSYDLDGIHNQVLWHFISSPYRSLTNNMIHSKYYKSSDKATCWMTEQSCTKSYTECKYVDKCFSNVTNIWHGCRKQRSTGIGIITRQQFADRTWKMTQNIRQLYSTIYPGTHLTNTYPHTIFSI